MADSASMAMPHMAAAMLQTPGTTEKIETSNVPIVDLPQATPNVAGPAEGIPISHSSEPQFSLAQPHTALPCTAFWLCRTQLHSLLPCRQWYLNLQ